MAQDPLKIVSWNINSVRLRLPNIQGFVSAESPDVMCLQEIKCKTDEFPEKAFRQMGLPYLNICGQGGGHHGVAIASRFPLDPVDPPALCREGHARINCARLKGLTLHNIYLPAGGDVPDPEKNEKFAHKLDFVDRMARVYENCRSDGQARLILGDLNIAPHPNDVWSHRQLLKIVSHTPIETDRLEAVRQAGGFTDLARHQHAEDQKLYTWWSYRARDWAASNRGRRLDHIWSNEIATPQIIAGSYRIHLGWRGGWKPSDHAPISICINPDAQAYP